MMRDWMLYGASGYTGELIAREAARRKLRPILAGRSAAATLKLAEELALPGRVFDLADAAAIVPHLSGVELVLSCAGPFSATAAPLREACLRAGAHYLDITGEIDVVEAAAAQHERARQAGIALIPAVGFDVVPSDCLAAMLASQLPGASRLQLAFTAVGGISPGTAKTILEHLPHGGLVRRNGRLAKVPLAAKTRRVPFPAGTRTAALVPWGDLASAYHSTGIGNIEVYMAVSRARLRWLRRLRWLLPLLAWRPLQRYLMDRIQRTTRGPSAEERSAQRASFWGRVEDHLGRGVEATLTTPSGYALTVLTALAAVERILAGGMSAGFHTPSQAFGREFILSIPGCEYKACGKKAGCHSRI